MESIKTENSIVICDYYETGLLKNGEPVAIESISGVDEKLNNEFNGWLNEARELLQPFAFTVEMLKLYRPQLADIKYHNRDGFELAKRIKSIVGDDMNVYYSCVDISLLLEQAKNRWQ
jgi:hypothetical protein